MPEPTDDPNEPARGAGAEAPGGPALALVTRLAAYGVIRRDGRLHLTDTELGGLWLADVAERMVSVERSRDGARPG